MASPEEKCNVLIVMGDGRYGSMLERFLCEMHLRNFNRVVGLVDARYREAPSACDTHPELPEDCQVEYLDMASVYAGNDEELSRVLRDNAVDWLCLVPFGNSFHRPEEVLAVLQCYKKNRGRNVLLLSSVGAEGDKFPVADLKACEDNVRTQFPTMNCVLRTHVLLEDLDFFSRPVRHSKTWRLATGDGSFAPVSFKEDVVLACSAIMTPKTIDAAHRDQIYTLTGDMAVNGISLAQMTGVAFDERDVRFAPISIEEARGIIDSEIEKSKKGRRRRRGSDVGGWLTRLTSRFSSKYAAGGGKHHREEEKGEVDDGAERGVGGIDTEYTSEIERDMILNRCELVQAHQLNIVTTHVRDLTGRPPVTVPAYLRSNEGSFKGKN